jgi:ATP-dependent Lhr-like helicase
VAGGFSAVYDVLKRMEETGRARRGYFVAGLGATQFALPGAEERLRALREPAEDEQETIVLAATDPASPYGAALAWPARDGDGESRPQRAAGAHVVLHAGELAGWIGRSEQTLLTFLPADEPERSRRGRALARALAGLVDSGARRALLISRIDGEPAHASPFAPLLSAAGFAAGHKGYLKRAPLDHMLRPSGSARRQGDPAASDIASLRLRAPRGPLGPDVDPMRRHPTASDDELDEERGAEEG